MIGIAGAGMSALADCLRSRGWLVSGSDDRLAHGESNGIVNVLESTDLVVHSAAIPPQHRELQWALARGIETVSYPEMLGRLMAACRRSGGRGLAVAGTHGKSTTTALAAHILKKARIPATSVFGARFQGRVAPARPVRKTPQWRHDSCFLVEACEYREHFCHLRPNVAAMLNIEPDHFDCFAGLSAVEAAFAKFAAQVEPSGELIFSAQCPVARRVAQAAGRQSRQLRLTTFGVDVAADWRAGSLEHAEGIFSFDLFRQGQNLGRMRLSIPGQHNVANAVAAAALARSAGASFEAIRAGICDFPGIKRRMELSGAIGDVAWVDDYAHHPSEISVVLATVRQMFPRGRVWCVFQPHQVSRTSALLDEFASSLQNTDTVYVTDIYRAREGAPRPGEVGPADLAERIRNRGGNSPDKHSLFEIENLLADAIADQRLGPRDVLVTLGAGNVESIAHGLVQRFRKCRAAG